MVSRLEGGSNQKSWWSQWRYHLRDMFTLVREWQWVNNSCEALPRSGISKLTVILGRDLKSIIRCPSGRQAVQSFMMTSGPELNLATNSFGRIGWSGKVAGESIFKCRSHITADIHVLEVDARYKIRYDEVFDTLHREVSKGRKNGRGEATLGGLGCRSTSHWN